MKYFILFIFIVFIQNISAQNPNKVDRSVVARPIKVENPEKIITEDIVQLAMTGDVIAHHYTLWTGKRVIFSNAALTKQITFIQKAPISHQQAADLLEKSCILEGLVFVPSGDNEVKLVVASAVKPQGLDLIIEEALLPEGDVVVSYLLKFKHISANDALNAFKSVGGNAPEHSAMTIIENTNALIITEKASMIRSLIKVQDAIDLPQSQVSTKMIELKHADAEVLAQSLLTIISAQVDGGTRVAQQGQTPHQNTPRNVPTPAAGNNAVPTTTNTQNQAQGNTVKQVSITADTRLNSVFVIGRPVDILFVENLVSLFDQPSKQRGFHSFKLKYIEVNEFLPVARSGIERTIGSTSAAGGASSSTQPSSSNRTSSGGEESRGTELADIERAEQPESFLVGKTLLVSDSVNNKLLVQGPPQSIEVVKALIDEMDVATEQVQITAIFGRYTMDGENSFGVDLARVSNGSSNVNSFAGNSGTGFPLVASPNSITTPELLPAAADAIMGLALYGQVDTNFFAFIRALESKGKFKLLSRPTLITKNNRKALFSSGQRIAVPTSTLSQATTGTTVSSNTNIEFRDVLLKLEVIPLVNSADEVTLKISFLNDNVIGTQTINGNSIPTIGTEEIFTTVKVPNNGTIVLGGLITERTTDNKSGIPILSSIPGLGKIFSSTSKATEKEELVILIQPKIIKGVRALEELHTTNLEDMEILREIQSDLLPRVNDTGKKKQRTLRKTKQNLSEDIDEDLNSPRSRFKGSRR